MYAKRNNIMIAIIWVVLSISGILWFTRETNQIEDLKIENKELSRQLAGCLEVVQALNTVETKYRPAILFSVEVESRSSITEGHSVC